jgi:hypothetical protein
MNGAETVATQVGSLTVIQKGHSTDGAIGLLNLIHYLAANRAERFIDGGGLATTRTGGGIDKGEQLCSQPGREVRQLRDSPSKPNHRAARELSSNMHA